MANCRDMAIFRWHRQCTCTRELTQLSREEEEEDVHAAILDFPPPNLEYIPCAVRWEH